MAMIQGYPEGSDITILDCFYTYPKQDEEGKYSDDLMTILYKDNITGRKGHQIIRKPDYEYYITKDDIQIDHPLLFIEKEKVNPVRVEYSKLLKDIAERTDNTQFYYNNLQMRNARANRELHTLYNIFNSDTDIADHYRFRFSKEYTNEQKPISKAYFDIEVDTINMKGDFPEMGECPINAVSYIHGNQVYSFLLRNPDNPLIAEFENSINADLFKELDDFIIENVGGRKAAERYGLGNLEYQFLFYDEELRMIQDLFMLINQQEPDFLLAWNMAFDVPYIMERLIEMGIDPADIMCHPSFTKGERVAKYYIDERHATTYEARGDRYTVSSHTVYLDQLIHFASRRKGQSAFPDFKLDTAGSIIAGVRKLDYSHITTSIAKLPYLNYKIFVFYNIMDTIVQRCIEERTQDIDFVFSKCLINNTRYEKCHRQTIYLVNRACKCFYENGFIIGNNQNLNTEAVPFAGALVGDPTHNSDYSKLKGINQTYNVIDNSVDFDYKSLYPNDDTYFNMAPNTQIGKIIISNQVHKLENPYDFEYYDRGGQYLEDFTSRNYIEFCNRWLGYASFSEWIEDLLEYINTIEPYVNSRSDNAFVVMDNDKLQNAFEYTDGSLEKAMMYVSELDYQSYLREINYM